MGLILIHKRVNLSFTDKPEERDRMESGRNDEENGDARSREGARTLFLRLLQRLTRPALPAAGDEAPADSLLPPGQRSGSGTESLAPYLSNYRNSLPGPLE
jgi:hypothetical protein